MQRISLALEEGRFEDAYTFFQEDYSEKPLTNDAALLNLKVLFFNQKYQQVLNDIDWPSIKCLASDEDIMYYGICLDACGQSEAAFTLFVDYFGKDPELIGVCRFMAALSSKLSHWSDAAYYYQRVFELSNKDLDNFSALVNAYSKLEDKREGAQFLSDYILMFNGADFERFSDDFTIQSVLSILLDVKEYDVIITFCNRLISSDLAFSDKCYFAKVIAIFLNFYLYNKELMTLCFSILEKSQDPLDQLFRLNFVQCNYTEQALIDDKKTVFNQLTKHIDRLPSVEMSIKDYYLLMNNNFYAIYHGYSLKPYLSQLYDLLMPLLPQLPVVTVKNHHKPRLGIISNYFFNHSVMHFYSKFIESLPDSFDVYIILLTFDQQTSEYVSSQFTGDHITFINLSSIDFNQRCLDILNLELSGLFYLDIHMHPASTALAMCRLAPVQFAGMGHPTTTGMNSIDYYLSAEIFEPKDADSHYSETLIRMPGMPIQYHIEESPSDYSWTDLGFNLNDHIYFCPMVPFKLMPEFDEIIEQILIKDNLAKIVFVKFRNVDTIVLERFAKFASKIRERISWIEPVVFSDYLALLKGASVVLDTFPFSGGNTILQSFFVGTPVATLEGKFMRGRFTSGYYRRMGLEHFINYSKKDYVAFAVECASNQECRTKIRNLILEKNDSLFNKSDGINYLMDFFLPDTYAD